MGVTGPPDWGPDRADVRALWSLDPDVAYLNHGAYGATPLPVLEVQAQLRAELERSPTDFLQRTYPERIAAARIDVARFLGADPEGIAFVPNATTGVAAVLRGIRLEPGDDVVCLDHAYPAIRAQLDRWTRAAGATLTVAHLPLPTSPADDLSSPVLAACSDRTRLLVVDSITSLTALVLPVADLVRETRARGIRCLIDAAHAPGMQAVDLTALDADWWTGNLHKWAGAPKGAAVLWTRAEERAAMTPLVESHVFGPTYPHAYDWVGTADPTPWLAAPTGIAVLGDLGWERLRAHNHTMAAWGARLVADAIGTTPPYADVPTAHAAMTLVDPGPLTPEQGADVRERLWHEHRVEVPVMVWADRVFLRLSAQVYNTPEDYERLADALPRVLP